MKKIIFILLSLGVFACSSKRESPMIYFGNASSEPITKIYCAWGKNKILTLSKLLPGESRSQAFYIKKSSDFFGLVKVFWINANGEKISRDFNFRRHHMPNIDDKEEYNYVQIYLDQKGMEVLSSDAPDLANKNQRMDSLMAQYNREYLKNNADDKSTLISVDPTQDRSAPHWLKISQ